MNLFKVSFFTGLVESYIGSPLELDEAREKVITEMTNLLGPDFQLQGFEEVLGEEREALEKEYASEIQQAQEKFTVKPSQLN